MNCTETGQDSRRLQHWINQAIRLKRRWRRWRRRSHLHKLHWDDMGGRLMLRVWLRLVVVHFNWLANWHTYGDVLRGLLSFVTEVLILLGLHL